MSGAARVGATYSAAERGDEDAWVTSPPGRIAIVHDWLKFYSGAEQVLEQMLKALPSADLFAIADFLQPRDRAFLRGRPVRTTFVQRLPFASSKYRGYLPLMPLAIESIDLSGYDLVISRAHAVAKGVITGPNQLHICMCYSPMRYAWDLQHQYLVESGLHKGVRGWMARLMLHKMRNWDVRSATGVDHFIAISRYIARRIEKAYRRPASVIYPPVNTEYFVPGTKKDDFFVTASRLVPYKRVDLIAQAFRSLPDKRLIVVGDGPEMPRVRKAAGPNVQVMGWQPIEVVRDLLQRARAFVYAAEEDFGIAVVEAQACGTPVIAYGVGGSTETVVGWQQDRALPAEPTGVFFQEQSTSSIVEAICAFERDVTISPTACRVHATRFATAKFQDEFTAFLRARWNELHRPSS